MYLLIIFLPLINSLCCLILGRFLGFYGASTSSIFFLFLSFFFSITIFTEVGLAGSPCTLILPKWMFSELLCINWGFLFDPLTCVLLLVVSFISFLVHLYSIEYMGEDPHFVRFMAYISLFTFFMYILITGDNMVQLFVGWEGVGLCSYLLINFWYTRIQANKAAIKAMLVNRVGDFALSLGIFCCFLAFCSIKYNSLFSIAAFFNEYTINFLGVNFTIIDLACILLFLGAMGKSAQIGLHTWLPDAMEGPTPVSALIHAATMVTAGVFFVARCSPLFEFSPKVLAIVCVIGSFTAFFAATSGLFQNDLKKVIAYSTCSQLGYMVFACGISCYNVSVFHLYNHAFFKALLFLGAGSVIHGLSDEQDMRRMGGLRKMMPFTYAIMLIGSLALMGFPFLTGFYSKDVILEAAYAKYTSYGLLAYYLGVAAAFCTAFYSFRLIFLTFLSKPSGYRRVIINAHESPFPMYIPLAILTIPSIFIGYLSKDFFVGFGSDFWLNSIFVHPTNFEIISFEFIPLKAKLIPLLVSFSGGALAFTLYAFYYKFLFNAINNRFIFFKAFYYFLNRRWIFDFAYNYYIAKPTLSVSYFTSYKTLDRGVIELLGPAGITGSVKASIMKLSNLQSGYLFHYSILLIGGFLLFFGFSLFTITAFYFKVFFLTCFIFLVWAIDY